MESFQWKRNLFLGHWIKFRASTQIDKFISLYTLVLYLYSALYLLINLGKFQNIISNIQHFFLRKKKLCF